MNKNYEKLKQIRENSDLSLEEWKTVRKYKDYYEVSNYGFVKSWHKCKKGKCLVPRKNHENDERRYVHLYLHGIATEFDIALLVAEHFIPNPNNWKYVRHIDGNPKNNKVSNLEWSEKRCV